MLNRDLYQQFLQEIPVFDEKIHAFEAGEIDRNTFKGISGGFGSYAQREGGYMLRLRLPGGRISKDILSFLAQEISSRHINLLKITTCQTIQLHNLSADDTVGAMRNALDVGIITKGGGDNPETPWPVPCPAWNPERLSMCSPMSRQRENIY